MSKHAAPVVESRRRRRPAVDATGARRWSTTRLFAVYAAVTLVPVLLIATVMLMLLDSESRTRGLDEGRAKADLLARTAISPLLDGRDLRQPLTSAEQLDLARTVASAVHDQQILRLRLRDLDCTVIFANDDTVAPAEDDEAEAAANGHVVAHLTHLNADDDSDGDHTSDLGPRVVEIYEPLYAAGTWRRIGVLEMYLPYAPIAADISRGHRTVVLALGGGLALLWLCLMGVSASVIDKLRRQAAANAFLARHDPLTGLPNRAEFSRLAHQATAQPASVAVALVNIDRFREVNDALGHDNGDRLIATVAGRLRSVLRADDVVARLGGDEFGVILRGTHDEAQDTFGRLRNEISAPVVLDEVPLTVEASVGFALTPDDGSDAESLLRKADIALMVSKRDSRGTTRFQPELDTFDASALLLLAQLGEAIESGQLVLHLQPKGDLRSGRVAAVEALVRWQHPTRGLLYPDAFLPAVEQTGLIDDLTRWLLREVGTILRGLDESVSAAVNISARSLIRADFADEVIGILASSGTDPGRIILEITETAIVADPPRATRTLNRLAAAGLRISVDDFGAGQTGLGHLTTLPLYELKIDKAFVMSMAADERNAAVVRSVIELGHSLGVHVTAEGVETRGDLDRLRSLGCDTVQGYLLSRPVPVPALPSAIDASTELLSHRRLVH